MKKLLILAHYYIPDMASTGQILSELAEGLLDRFEVTVICVVPSYEGLIEEKYRTHKYYHEIIHGVNIIRLRVPAFNKTRKLSRIRNILLYFLRAVAAIDKIERHDYVLAVSQPPILGGLLGVYGKWRLGGKTKDVKYIYQIQDINPEQIRAVGYFKNRVILWLLEKIDTFSCRQADLIITVGRDMVETIEKRFKHNFAHMPKTVLINNWINEKEIYPLPENNEHVIKFKEQYSLKDKFNIVYSGNLGQYYDLLGILQVIEKFNTGISTVDGRKVVFSFIGAGTMLKSMQCYCEEHSMTNVVFIPYQDKQSLIYSLNAGDVHWCVNAKGVKGVSCPSKYYGIAAVGKPVLAVLERGSEIECLISKIHGGLICEPGDYIAVEKNIRWFIQNAGSKEIEAMGIRNRKYLENELAMQRSLKKYADEIYRLSGNY